MNGSLTRRSRLTPLAAVAVALSAAGCGDGETQAPDGRRGPGNLPTPAVEVIQARFDALPLQERLTGTVQAAGQVSIFPQTSGRIAAVYAENGDVVQQGAPLVRIEAEAPASQLTQAEANLNIAQAQANAAEANLAEMQSQLRRTLLLAEDSLVSQETVETQRAQVESARANLAQAEAQVQSARAAITERAEAVSRTVVRAPITGVVGRRTAEVGMIPDGQTPLFVMGRMDRMRVEVPVSQDLIGRIVPGQRAEISTEGQPGAPIEAEVSRLSPFLSEGTFSAEAEIDVPNPAGRLVPGMFVAVDVFYGESDSTTVVPTSALYDNPISGQTGVYIASVRDSGWVQTVSDDSGNLSAPTTTRFVPVEVIAQGRQTAAVSRVQPGDWVVVIGQNLLSAQPEPTPEARLRPMPWQQILELQRLQGQDLLEQVLQEHRQQGLQTELQPPTGTENDGGSSESRGS